jgi:hypothetical protein
MSKKFTLTLLVVLACGMAGCRRSGENSNGPGSPEVSNGEVANDGAAPGADMSGKEVTVSIEFPSMVDLDGKGESVSLIPRLSEHLAKGGMRVERVNTSGGTTTLDVKGPSREVIMKSIEGSPFGKRVKILPSDQ